MSRPASLLWLIVTAIALLNLHFSCPAHGQELVGPESIESGKLARFSIAWPEDSEPGSAAWIVFPLGSGDLDVCGDSGSRAVFTGLPSNTPYTILVSVVHNGRPMWLTHQIVVDRPSQPDPGGPIDPQDPSEPDPGDSLEGLARVAYDQAKRTGDRTSAVVIAGIWEATAAQLVAGSIGAQESLITIGQRSREEIGPAYEAWREPMRMIGDHAATPPPQTIAELADRLRTVAGALRIYGGSSR